MPLLPGYNIALKLAIQYKLPAIAAVIILSRVIYHLNFQAHTEFCIKNSPENWYKFYPPVEICITLSCFSQILYCTHNTYDATTIIDFLEKMAEQIPEIGTRSLNWRFFKNHPLFSILRLENYSKAKELFDKLFDFDIRTNLHLVEMHATHTALLYRRFGETQESRIKENIETGSQDRW